jgi:hypothetical protein
MESGNPIANAELAGSSHSHAEGGDGAGNVIAAVDRQLLCRNVQPVCKYRRH